MSDTYIEIFGKIETAEALSALAEAAAGEGGIDWGKMLEDEDEAVSEILSAADFGASFSLMRNEASSPFEAVTQACFEHGISYVLKAGEEGGEGYNHIEAWGPGMDAPYQGLCNDDIQHVPLNVLKDAAEKGIDAVRDVIADIERKTFLNVTERRIEVSPEARDAFSTAPGA